jgi:hypothetical protein
MRLYEIMANWQIEEQYAYGDCDILAIGLHIKLKLPLRAVVDGDKYSHVWVSPSPNTALDIWGERPEKEIYQAWIAEDDQGGEIKTVSLEWLMAHLPAKQKENLNQRVKKSLEDFKIVHPNSRLIESFGKVFNFDPQLGDKTLFDLDVKARNGSLTQDDLKSFRALLNRDKNAFVRMYHGTSSSHDVLGKGLLPTSPNRSKSLQSAAGYVYVAYDPRMALAFARHAYPSDNEFTVYAVDVTIARLLPDHDQLRNKRHFAGIEVGDSLVDSLIFGGGARVKGKISPMQIHIYGKFDKSGKEIDF